VRVELERKDDEVLEWAAARESLFVAFEENVQVSVREILRDHPRLVDTRRGRSGADRS
jgi:hypothetical protein